MTAIASVTCGARTRSGGECGRPAGWGTDHVGAGCCKLHGGSTPSAQIAGVVQLATRRAAVMGIPLDIGPHDSLLECIRITAGEVQYASERIAELKAEDAIGGVVTVHRRPRRYEGGGESGDTFIEETKTESPHLHIWIKVRQQAMDRLVNYSAVALKAGIEERQVRIVERIGEQLSSVFERVLGAIPDLTESQRALGLQAYASELRQLEAPLPAVA